jgi:23S rRNA pseudouridine1911/1915/1917 synthase
LITPLLNIIHESADLLVVHKPAGLVCHPTKGDEYSSLISRARLYLRRDEFHESHSPSQSASSIQYPASSILQPLPSPHLIHRLDRETSGLVVIAKNPIAARELGRIWETREVRKEYLAIVHGHVPAEQGTIDAPLGKDLQSRIAIKDCVRPDGSPAQTDFHVEKRFSHSGGTSSTSPTKSESDINNDKVEIQPFSLLCVTPRSGRKHQICIHLSYFGHSIVGDKIYGGDEDAYLALVENRLTDEQRRHLILTYQALHASRITFNWRGTTCDFSCPPEPWFTEFIGL